MENTYQALVKQYIHMIIFLLDDFWGAVLLPGTKSSVSLECCGDDDG